MTYDESTTWQEALGSIPDLRVLWDEPMSRHTSFRIGGPADAVVWADTREQLAGVFDVARRCAVPLFVLGRGSNLLIADAGLRGMIAKLGKKFEEVRVEGARVTSGAAVPMSALSKECAKSGLSGAEFMFGIPGSVGGGVRMNAGAHGRCMADIVSQAVAFGRDGEFHVLDTDALGFEYRDSALGDYVCATEATFAMTPADSESVQAWTKESYYERMAAQPLSLPSAGCVFRNPDVRSAGELIDRCGLKGLAVGGARVSEKHANFIVASDGATAEDVLRLIDEIKSRVKAATGSELELEIKIVAEE